MIRRSVFSLLRLTSFFLVAGLVNAGELFSSPQSETVTSTPMENKQMRDWSMQAFLSEDVSNAIAINHSFLGEGLPFSFTYGGVSSAELIPQWTRSSETRDFSDKSECKICWIDPKSGLQVTAVVTIFKSYPAVDWVLYFENQGEADTPIIENIQAK